MLASVAISRWCWRWCWCPKPLAGQGAVLVAVRNATGRAKSGAGWAQHGAPAQLVLAAGQTNNHQDHMFAGPAACAVDKCASPPPPHTHTPPQPTHPTHTHARTCARAPLTHPHNNTPHNATPTPPAAQQVQYAFLAGLALVLLLIPVNRILATRIQAASVQMMGAKDRWVGRLLWPVGGRLPGGSQLQRPAGLCGTVEGTKRDRRGPAVGSPQDRRTLRRCTLGVAHVALCWPG